MQDARHPSAGTRLRAWRERALLTQEQLAERTGLSVRTIRRIESDNEQRPRSASVHALAEVLNLDSDEREALIVAFRGVSGGGRAAQPTAVPPRQLPPGSPHFLGRHKELALLHGSLCERRPAALTVIGIVGGAGIGKTSLAVHWCASVAREFPDGQLYLNLRGFGTLSPLEPLTALKTLLRGIGVPPEQIPDDLVGAAALFRTCTADRRLIVLLDNALNSEQVRPLLPGPGCVAVITSRDQLRSLTAREATARISVAPLHPAESVELLSRISGRPSINRRDPAVRRLTKLCDNSPLALRIIAERIAREPAARLSEVVDEIGHVRLDAFSGGEDASSDLRMILSWSYENLDTDSAWMLRILGAMNPGPDFGAETASALSGFPVEEAKRHLNRLVATHLVERHGSGRYYMHDLVRAYAAAESRRRDSEAVAGEAASRLLTWFLRCLYAADAAFAPDRMREPMLGLGEAAELKVFPDLPAALSWCVSEHQTLVALPGWACAHDRPEAAGRLAYLLESYLAHYKCYHELLSSHQAVMRVLSRLDAPQLEGHLHSAMGNTFAELGRPKDARQRYHRALLAFRACGDRRGEAKVLGNLAMVETDLGAYRTAVARCEEALAAADASGYERGRAHTLDTLGEAHLGLGDFAAAIACWHQALDINRKSGAPFVVATNLTHLGRAYSAAGDHDSAISLHREAISISQIIGSIRGEATALHNLGAAHHATGDKLAARADWRRALVLYRRLGDARADEVQKQLR